MRTAIIGYGSLIWDLENLAPWVSGGWQRGSGPALPVEFSRISPKRKMGLVLVIDNDLDHDCATSVIQSSRSDLDQAIADLAARERCPENRVGLVSKADPAMTRAKSADVTARVGHWLERSNYDAAIWTDLDANFSEHTGDIFDHARGHSYLRTLQDASLAEAWRYISYAPEETDTPFRRHLATDEWWCSLDFGDQADKAK